MVEHAPVSIVKRILGEASNSEYPDPSKLKSSSVTHSDGTTTITHRRVAFKNGHNAWEGWKIANRYVLLDKDGKPLAKSKDLTRIKRIRALLSDPEIGEGPNQAPIRHFIKPEERADDSDLA